METIGRIVVILFVVLIVGTGLYFALRTTLAEENGITLTGAAINATATTTEANPNEADEIGSIYFYVQQGHEVPYLFYTDNGKLASRALIFPNDATCYTSIIAPCPGSTEALKAAYGSGPVHVQGTFDEESLVVSSMSGWPS